MTVQEIEKLKKVDEIMFNLQNSTDPQKALLQAGEFLKGLKLIDDQTNIEGIIQTYTDNLHKQLAKIIQRKAVSYNWTTLEYLRKYADEDGIQVEEHFKEYALIVLRFNDQLTAWRNEMDGQNYRILAQNLDHERSNIHDFCLMDIKLLDRLANINKQESFVMSQKTNPDRTDFGQAIVKACCENTCKILASLK